MGAADLQRRLELLGVHEVVLDGVAVAGDLRVFEAGKRADDRVLHVRRQRGRDAVHVEPGVLEPLRLDEDLVALFLGEADDFVLDRWAVARAGGLDLAGVHRGAVEVRADQLVGFRTRVCEVAEHLREREAVRQNRERAGLFVARRLLQPAEVDARLVDARRSPGLEAAELQAERR